MNNDSTFGAEPYQLQRLFEIGLDKDTPDSDEDVPPITHWDLLKEKPGSRIGPYLITQILGEGGMGNVYLAEQEKPIKRQVALKVIKPGMDSRRVIARFEAEQQTLALLDHPNIAHVHDAGTTDTGRPFFVMEYVKGVSITDYCDLHKLTIEERLNLFLNVCQAAHHAHQKGIIHRDIKPSNILVSIHEDQAIPKIIDFGVAKAVSQPLTERTLYTEQGQLFGTPEYMSPEQADMAKEDIDIRSDIYSLGVLLYVLLTGVLPFESETLREGGIDSIRKIIRHTDPKTPSTRLTKLGDEAKKVAENRQTEVGALARYLRRELEWIPLKAMRKERAERYRSASELADDVANYLKGSPLIAGPPTAWYHLRKTLRRHKILLGGIAAVLVVSVIGVIVSFTFALGQSSARAESEAVRRFLSSDVLGAVNSFKGSEAMTVDVFNAAMAELLDLASKEIEVKLLDQPVVEAEISVQLGQVYSRVNDFKAAATHTARSYQLRRDHLGEHAGLTIRAKRYLASASAAAGQYNEAERLWKELIEASRSRKELIGTSYSRWWECNLALTYLDQGRYKEAEQLFLKNLETDTLWWEGWPGYGTPYLEDLAIVYLYQGRYEAAERLFDQLWEELKEENDDDVPLGKIEFVRLGYVYMAQGRYKKAVDLFTRGIEFCNRKFLGKGHRLTLAYTNGLAVLHTKQKDYEEAERLFQEILVAIPRRWGLDHPRVLETVNDFGILRRKQKDYTEAENLLSQASKGREVKLGPDHPATFESMHELAKLYKEQARYEEAEQLLLKAIKGRRLKLGDTHPHTKESLNDLIALYEVWNKPEKVNEWGAKLSQTEDLEE